jgi:pimeloyl-ACP methyl ester carboxylesterase
VTGLGKLVNTVGDGSENLTTARMNASNIPISNSHRTQSLGLRIGNSKALHYDEYGVGSGLSPIIFIHGLGGSTESFFPFIFSLGLPKTRKIYSIDLEGHGLSPTSATSVISIASFASDVYALAKGVQAIGVTIVAHGMGCLVACLLAIEHPAFIFKLVLLGPNRSPLSISRRIELTTTAAAVRTRGMTFVTGSTLLNQLNRKISTGNGSVIGAVRLSLLGQDPEGYAKACMALANETEHLPVHKIEAKTLIVTGDEDVDSPPAVCEEYAAKIPDSRVVILPETGNWLIFENLKGVTDIVGPFLLE